MTSSQITLYVFLAGNIIAWVWGAATVKTTVDFIRQSLVRIFENQDESMKVQTRHGERLAALESDLDGLKHQHYQNHRGGRP